MAVLRILIRTGGGQTITGLQRRSWLAASTLARHLRTLAICGLVIQERKGREVITRPNSRHVSALSRFLIWECCDHDHSEAANAAGQPESTR